jgi:hypothetical protein
VASVGITWRRRLVKLALCVVALLSGIATPFEAMALYQPERPLLVLLLVPVLFVHAMTFVFGLILIFSWGNHDGVRIPREDRFFRKGHPVLSAPGLPLPAAAQLRPAAVSRREAMPATGDAVATPPAVRAPNAPSRPRAK